MDFDTPWRCRPANLFEKINVVGEGTYGRVFKVRDKIDKRVYAMKKIKMDREKEGFPITALREIKLLKQMRHENIVNLCEIVTSRAQEERLPGNVYLLFEYMQHDLEGLLNSTNPVIPYTISHLKCFIKQMLQSLEYLHGQNIVHRDLKCANLLVNNNGEVKLADFGLARSLTNNARDTYTNRVITLWYRPPELLLGGTRYGCEIDMWSAGCIIGEILSRSPMFPEPDEARMLNRIWKLCGTPTEELWPGHSSLPLFEKMGPRERMPRKIKLDFANRNSFPNFDPQAIDLIDKLLVLNPANRLTATQALAHPYFNTEPLPCDPSELPTVDTEIHEDIIKKQKLKQKEAQSKIPCKRPPSNHADSPSKKFKG